MPEFSSGAVTLVAGVTAEEDKVLEALKDYASVITVGSISAS